MRFGAVGFFFYYYYLFIFFFYIHTLVNMTMMKRRKEIDLPSLSEGLRMKLEETGRRRVHTADLLMLRFQE